MTITRLIIFGTLTLFFLVFISMTVWELVRFPLSAVVVPPTPPPLVKTLPHEEPTPPTNVPVQVGYPVLETPTKNQSSTSPLVVKGSAPGNWYFEASFPVMLKNEKGDVITQLPAQAKGDWMTTDYVPFEVSIPFSVKEKTNATLVLKNDNPSGMPENDKSIEIPVVLEP